MSFSFSSSPDDATPIPHQGGASSSGNHSSEVERDMLAEARLLRQHKTRLEARMKILEEHNRQLETQLSRLRQLLDEVWLKLIPFYYFVFKKIYLTAWRKRSRKFVAGKDRNVADQVSHRCSPRNRHTRADQWT